MDGNYEFPHFSNVFNANIQFTIQNSFAMSCEAQTAGHFTLSFAKVEFSKMHLQAPTPNKILWSID